MAESPLHNLTFIQREAVKDDMRLAFQAGEDEGILKEMCKDLFDELKMGEESTDQKAQKEAVKNCNSQLDFDAWFKIINVEPKKEKRK